MQISGTRSQIACRQFLDLLLPLGIVALLVFGLVVFRKMITRDVLVLAFTDGSSKAIEGLERAEAERVREEIEEAIASRGKRFALRSEGVIDRRSACVNGRCRCYFRPWDVSLQ